MPLEAQCLIIRVVVCKRAQLYDAARVHEKRVKHLLEAQEQPDQLLHDDVAISIRVACEHQSFVFKGYIFTRRKAFTFNKQQPLQLLHRAHLFQHQNEAFILYVEAVPAVIGTSVLPNRSPPCSSAKQAGITAHSSCYAPPSLCMRARHEACLKHQMVFPMR